MTFYFFAFSFLLTRWAMPQSNSIVPPEYLQVSPQIRADYLARAILWEPKNIAEINAELMRQGEPSSLRPDQQLVCTYVRRTRRELGGTSPKFECEGQNSEIYRIKYGRVKPHTTVAASRLMWALGFGAPISTPVTVICNGCSEDPWNTPRRIYGQTTFKEAVIQESKSGTEIIISSRPESGWSWRKDLPLVSEEYGGATRAQIDALKLIAVLIQHGDSKAAQQKLICRPSDYEASDQSCRKPYMYIYDLGNTFGSDGMRVHPLNFDEWKRKRLFKDPSGCVGNLRQNAFNGGEGLTFPKISEEGRLFLSSLLCQFILDRARVVAMFDIAHMETADQKHTAEDWADVFISKAREVINHAPCPR